MAQMIRFAAAAVLAAIVCLLLRRSNPELQLPLSLLVCGFILWGAAVLVQPAAQLLQTAASLSGLSAAYYLPVVKCVAIGILAKGAGDLCRDGGQSALAGAVELGGAAAALYVSLQLLTTLLGLLGKML